MWTLRGRTDTVGFARKTLKFNSRAPSTALLIDIPFPGKAMVSMLGLLWPSSLGFFSHCNGINPGHCWVYHADIHVRIKLLINFTRIFKSVFSMLFYILKCKVFESLRRVFIHLLCNCLFIQKNYISHQAFLNFIYLFFTWDGKKFHSYFNNHTKKRKTCCCWKCVHVCLCRNHITVLTTSRSMHSS